MKAFIKWLWSGFGTETTAARALGMAVSVVLIGFIVIYYVVKGIVKLVRQKKDQTEQE